MCGIVGLYLKNENCVERLGEMFAPMLVSMTARGPDSAGIALYGAPAPAGFIKLTLRCGNQEYDWKRLGDDLGRRGYELGGQGQCQAGLRINANYAMLSVRGDEAPQSLLNLRQAVAEYDPELRVMSVGRSIEILKEVGLPQSIVDRFGVRKMTGTHVIGHTRMATESAVTTDGSHPFSTGLDLCLVHNGSLSNHNRLRQKLVRHGIEIRTQNDSEVAAGYLTWQLAQGKTLRQALESALDDLDGFYTFAIGTAGGFAVLRDPIACKPAVMAETDDYVAIGREFQALAALPGVDDANIWEPKPARVYTWSRN